MSSEITTAFVNQFSANIQMLSQQQGSLLRACVDEESVTGEKAFFDQVGSVSAIEKTTRHQDTPIQDTPHARRQVSLRDYVYADLIDDEDKIRMLQSPQSTYVRAGAAAMGRRMDDTIIASAFADANTGKDGGTSVSFPSGNVVAHGSAGLTLAKLISAKQILDEGSVDPSIKRFIVVAPKQMSDLLNSTTVTSADFNTVRALVQGSVTEFCGFTFITSNRLAVNGSSHRRVIAFAQDGLKLAVGMNPTAKVDVRPDKGYATQVFYQQSIGATRMQESMVVEVPCAE